MTVVYEIFLWPYLATVYSNHALSPLCGQCCAIGTVWEYGGGTAHVRSRCYSLPDCEAGGEGRSKEEVGCFGAAFGWKGCCCR